jgi:GDP-L-fucose synthase
MEHYVIMDKESKIFVAGHKGMVGSSIVRALNNRGFKNIITKNRSEVDLTKGYEVTDFFHAERPNYVFLAAAKVGGILANQNQKGDFIRDNLSIQLNVIDAAHSSGASKLLFLGSSCIYPRDCAQPIREDYLLSGPLEPSNDAYAIAKIAGIKMCESYKQQYGFSTVCLMPTNLYGPNDNFDLQSSHVFAAMLRKFHEAKVNDDSAVVCWGDGSPYREFLYVDDLSVACLHFMGFNEDPGLLNIGTGTDIMIKDLAETMASVIGYKGKIEWDTSKPNGTPRKLLSVEKAGSYGWNHSVGLRQGIELTYQWFLENV